MCVCVCADVPACLYETEERREILIFFVMYLLRTFLVVVIECMQYIPKTHRSDDNRNKISLWPHEVLGVGRQWIAKKDLCG